MEFGTECPLFADDASGHPDLGVLGYLKNKMACLGCQITAGEAMEPLEACHVTS